MRIRLSTTSIVSLGATWVLLSSCSGSGAIDPLPVGVGGGAIIQTGGMSNSSGGKATTGGTAVGTSGGSTNATGGKASNGGGSTGGNAATGAATSTGGATTSGGNTNRGGANTNGGTVNTGGTNTNGGTANRGGASTSGGTANTGGSGSCTDVPRSSESCADASTWGFCSQAWFAGYCQATCKTCGTGNGGSSSTGGSKATGGAATGGAATGGAATGGRATGGAATGGAATGGSTGGTSVPLLTNGSPGITTRYWDCCMPSCAWKGNAQADGKSSPATVCAKDGSTVVGESAKSACSGGSGYQCNWGAPWQAGPNLSYGYAAHNGGNCGKCYQLDFTGAGDNPGAQSLKGKTMIVQTVNTGGIASNQFDLLIPGGGVGDFNACTGSDKQWGNVNGGSTYGGFLATCGNNMTCITDMCKAAFGSNSSLMAGCNWFVGWFAAANNPKVSFAEVPCPADLTNRSGLK